MRLLVVVLVLASCYEPSLPDCVAKCADAIDCASGQICVRDGFCAARETTCSMVDGTHLPPDAPDVPPDDAPPRSRCEMTCPGTCDGDTCIVDCTRSGSCQEDITCPAGLPCRVACGTDACRHVRCDLATSCEITCNGKNSCVDGVTCGDGPCDVSCTGDHACRDGVRCADACACDVTCAGKMACRGGTSCPSSECESDDGCTSGGTCTTC